MIRSNITRYIYNDNQPKKIFFFQLLRDLTFKQEDIKLGQKMTTVSLGLVPSIGARRATKVAPQLQKKTTLRLHQHFIPIRDTQK